MGSDARWDSSSWKTYSDDHVAGKTADRIFTSRGMKDQFNPAKIRTRESRDSAINPNSTPIIIGSDVTASMDEVARILIQETLNTVCTGIYEHNPVPDPHIMIMAIGDVKNDTAPLQMTEFESSIVLAKQTKELFIEQGGGGNGGESYSLAHVAAHLKTSTDSFEKRGRKGFIFTIGDEMNHKVITAAQLQRTFGIPFKSDLTARQCLDMALERYEVFHIVLTGVGDARSNPRVLEHWQEFMGQRVLPLSDYTKLGEVIVSTMRVVYGEAKDSVAAGWGSGTDLVVANAIRDVAARSHSTGIRRLA